MKDKMDQFEEYLSGFEDIVPFDSETCPVCGVNISSSVSKTGSPLIEVYCSNDESLIQSVCTALQSKNIELKVIKQLDMNETEQVVYTFRISVPADKSGEAIQVINNFASSSLANQKIL